MQKFMHFELIKDYLDSFYDLLPVLLERFDQTKSDIFLTKITPFFRATQFDLDKLDEIIQIGNGKVSMITFYRGFFNNIKDNIRNMQRIKEFEEDFRSKF